jgi:hypothetical protein
LREVTVTPDWGAGVVEPEAAGVAEGMDPAVAGVEDFVPVSVGVVMAGVSFLPELPCGAVAIHRPVSAVSSAASPVSSPGRVVQKFSFFSGLGKITPRKVQMREEAGGSVSLARFSAVLLVPY